LNFGQGFSPFELGGINLALKEEEIYKPSPCSICGAWSIVKARIENLRDQAEEGRKLAEDYLSRLQRLQADFENYKKMVQKEREEISEFTSMLLVSKLLDVLDNLERAIDSAKRSDDKGALMQGVEMVYRQLRGILEREGLAPIEALGKTFDPFEHEAVEQVQSSEHEDGIIVEEVQRGYRFRSKVLRASKVKVAKGAVQEGGHGRGSHA
jgi:molecular chaperone GrpE